MPTQNGYDAFEAQTLIDTGDVSGQTSAGYQGEYQTDPQLEQGSLNYLLNNNSINSADANYLQGLINFDTGSTSGISS
jgi:hypothetical protein